MARWSQRRSVWVASICVGAVALVALVLDHRAHVLGAVPYLLLLACPLMHLWHGDHRHHVARTAPGHGQSGNSVSPGDARQGGHS
jgi:Protein of unknown function (DUF2933)